MQNVENIFISQATNLDGYKSPAQVQFPNVKFLGITAASIIYKIKLAEYWRGDNGVLGAAGG